MIDETAETAPRRFSNLKPAILCIAAILLMGGVAVFVGTVVVPLVKVHRMLTEVERWIHPGTTQPPPAPPADYFLKQLGGREWATPHLLRYRRLALWLAPHQDAALYLLAGCGKPALPAFVDLLENGKEDGYRAYAAGWIGGLGPDGRDAVPALTNALKDDSEDVRKAAAEALRKIRGEPPAP